MGCKQQVLCSPGLNSFRVVMHTPCLVSCLRQPDAAQLGPDEWRSALVVLLCREDILPHWQQVSEPVDTYLLSKGSVARAVSQLTLAADPSAWLGAASLMDGVDSITARVPVAAGHKPVAFPHTSLDALLLVGGRLWS